MAMEKVYASKGHSARVMSSISQLWHNKKYCDAVLQIGSKRLEVCLMGRIIFLMVNLLKLIFMLAQNVNICHTTF